MENKQKLKNSLIKEVSKDADKKNFVAILQGAPLQGKLSQGEVYLLAMFLPIKRQKEFLDYKGKVSFLTWNQLYLESTVEKIGKQFFDKMQDTAKTLAEKLMVLKNMEEIRDTDFEEALALVEDEDDCLALLDEVDTEKHIVQCLETLKTFNTSIDTWCEVQEDAYQFDCSQLVRIITMKEMIKKAEEKSNLPNWIKVYDHTLDGSEYDKLAIERIDGFRMNFEYWAEIYEKEKREHAKATRLALQKMQGLKGNYGYWLDLMLNSDAVISRQDIQAICLSMMQELEGTQEEYNETWEWLNAPLNFEWQIDVKMIFLLKMMQVTNKEE